MDVTLDLTLNAVLSGLLLGGFYAAVSIGVAISFGLLDIVNIAHPAFIILGSYSAYTLNASFGLDPVVTGIIVLPLRLFHQIQLMVCAVLARRYAQRAPTEGEIEAAASPR